MSIFGIFKGSSNLFFKSLGIFIIQRCRSIRYYKYKKMLLILWFDTNYHLYLQNRTSISFGKFLKRFLLCNPSRLYSIRTFCAIIKCKALTIPFSPIIVVTALIWKILFLDKKLIFNVLYWFHYHFLLIFIIYATLTLN